MKNTQTLISVPDTFFISEEKKITECEILCDCGDPACLDAENDDASEKRILEKFQKSFSGIKLSLSIAQLLSYRQQLRSNM